MGSGYKGIIIPQEIIIVENYEHQGFVVPSGNERVLETAMRWAERMVYPDEGTWEDRQAKAYKFEGIQHRYENGHFRMKLNESAGYSYNGGKLSFWNCDITAPDGRTYLVGINQDLLCNLLMNCTLVKGKVQEELWLGRQQNNTGLYTEQMDDFKQAQLEVKQKEEMKSKTKNYKPGDLVGTLTKDFIYVGEFSKTKNYWYTYDYSGPSYNSRLVVSSNTENVGEKFHLYLERYKYYHSDDYGYRLEVRDKKSSYTLKEQGYKPDISFESVKQYFIENSIYYYLIQLLQFEKNVLSVSEMQELLQNCTSNKEIICIQ